MFDCSRLKLGNAYVSKCLQVCVCNICLLACNISQVASQLFCFSFCFCFCFGKCKRLSGCACCCYSYCFYWMLPMLLHLLLPQRVFDIVTRTCTAVAAAFCGCKQCCAVVVFVGFPKFCLLTLPLFWQHWFYLHFHAALIFFGFFPLPHFSPQGCVRRSKL